MQLTINRLLRKMNQKKNVLFSSIHKKTKYYFHGSVSSQYDRLRNRLFDVVNRVICIPFFFVVVFIIIPEGKHDLICSWRGACVCANINFHLKNNLFRYIYRCNYC